MADLFDMNDDRAECERVTQQETRPTLRDAIESAINNHSAENGSDTPDFVLAGYLLDCLAAFDKATNARRRWYGPPDVPDENAG